MTYKNQNTHFVPHPEGTYEGVIYDVEDLGVVSTSFGDTHMLSIKIESFESNESGKPYTVWRRVRLSFDPRSNLSGIRKSVLGRTLTREELQEFDDRELLGENVGYQVEHNTNDQTGITYANLLNLWKIEGHQKPTLSRWGEQVDQQQEEKKQPTETAERPPADDSVTDYEKKILQGRVGEMYREDQLSKNQADTIQNEISGGLTRGRYNAWVNRLNDIAGGPDDDLPF